MLPGQGGDDLFAFLVGHGDRPPIATGERVYVVAHGRLRGYAPLVELGHGPKGWSLIRGGGAAAVTISGTIRGFSGYKERWWRREDERPFADWTNEDVPGARPATQHAAPARPAPPIEEAEGI